MLPSAWALPTEARGCREGSWPTRSSLDISFFNPAKLQKIVNVLMDQVERGIDFQGNAYSLFQTAILLEDKVRERTRRLEMALHDLERSNRELSLAKAQTETAQTRLMEAVESISEGFVQFDSDDRLVFCNTKFLEFWSGGSRHPRGSAAGRAFPRTLPLDGRERPRRRRWRSRRLATRPALSSQQSLRSDVVHLAAADGCRSASDRPETATPSASIPISPISSLDEERRREQELAEKSMLLQSTLDNLAQGVSRVRQAIPTGRLE